MRGVPSSREAGRRFLLAAATARGAGAHFFPRDKACSQRRNRAFRRADPSLVARLAGKKPAHPPRSAPAAGIAPPREKSAAAARNRDGAKRSLMQRLAPYR